MLPKAALTFLVVGVLSVSALTVPVARSPGPEPESKQLEARILSNLFWGRDLEFVTRELEARGETMDRVMDKAKAGYENVKQKVGLRRELELEARELEARGETVDKAKAIYENVKQKVGLRRELELEARELEARGETMDRVVDKAKAIYEKVKQKVGLRHGFEPQD